METLAEEDSSEEDEDWEELSASLEEGMMSVVEEEFPPPQAPRERTIAVISRMASSFRPVLATCFIRITPFSVKWIRPATGDGRGIAGPGESLWSRLSIQE